MPRWLRLAPAFIGELVAMVAVVFCIPFAIVAIGMPIVLLVRALLWLGAAL